MFDLSQQCFIRVQKIVRKIIENEKKLFVRHLHDVVAFNL